MRRVFIVLALSAWPFAQAHASPALTRSATTMYATASTRAHVVQSIPANAEIDLDHCDRAWCYVSWRDRAGYVSARALDSTPPDFPVAGPGPYGPPPPPPLAPPPYGYWGGPYVGWGWGWHRGRW